MSKNSVSQLINKAYDVTFGGKKSYTANPSKYQTPRKAVGISASDLLTRSYNLARGLIKK